MGSILPSSPEEQWRYIQSPKGGIDRSKLRELCSVSHKLPLPLLERAIAHTLDKHEITWDKGQEQLTIFQDALCTTIAYHGPGSPHGHWEQKTPKTHVGEIVDYLLGHDFTNPAWLSWKHVSGIFMAADKELMDNMQKEFARVLEDASQSLPPKSAAEETLFRAFIGNVIALLPYCYPPVGSHFTIPQKIDGVWKACVYTMDKHFTMTPAHFATPIKAFGLTSEEGPPLITFLGTTYPAGDGFLATLMADFTPGFSVGHVPYLIGKKQIHEWLKDKQDVRLYGMSLGGALAFHALRYEKEKIASVDAYSPPGLFSSNWKETYDRSPAVNIYYQDNDIVPLLGYFPTGSAVSLYHVVPEKLESSLKAHARVYTGSKLVTLLKGSTEKENRRPLRLFLTILHQICAPVIFLMVFVSQLIFSLIRIILTPFRLFTRAG